MPAARAHRWTLLAATGLALLALPLRAADLVGTNFEVSGRAGAETRPAVGFNPFDNQFLIVWEQEVTPGQRDIFGQRIDAATGAPIGVRFPIRTSLLDESAPRVAFSETSRSWGVVWTQGGNNVAGTLLNTPGAVIVQAFFVGNNKGTSTQPDIVWRSAQDQFCIVWVDTADGTGDLYGELRRADSGAVVVDDTVLRDVLAGTLETPRVVYNATRDAHWIAYVSKGAEAPSTESVFGFGFDGGLTTMTTPVTVLSSTAGEEARPAIAWDSAMDQYLVVFESKSPTFYDVFGQRVRPDGSLVGGNFAIANDPASTREQSAGVSFASSSNTYLVVWDEGPDGGPFDLEGREVGADGTPVGAVLEISQTGMAATNETFPAVAYGPGQWLTIWQDGRNLADFDIWGQRVAPGSASATLVSAKDSPDPFSPPVDGVNDTTTIQTRYDYRSIPQGTRVRTSVSIRAPGGSPVRMLTDERPVPAGTGTLDASVTWGGEDDAFQPVPDGTYSYLVEGTLLLPGGTSPGIQPQALGSVTVESSAPAFSSLLPSDGSFTNNARPTVSGFISDPTGLDTTTFRLFQNSIDVTGKTSRVNQISPPGLVFSFQPFADVPQGIVYLRAEIRDAAGNLGRADWSYVADRTLPTFGAPNPPNKSTVTFAQPEIAVQYQDDRSGIDVAGARIVVNGTDVTAQAIVTVDAVSYTPPTPLADGNVSVQVTARDLAGNSSIRSWSFTVVAGGPTIGNLAPAPGSYRRDPRPTVSGTFGGNPVNTSTFRLLQNGLEVIAQVTGSGFTFTPTVDVPEGVVSLRAEVQDTTGTPTSVDWTFTADRTAPTIADVSPADGALVADNRSVISASTTDTLAGIDASGTRIELNSVDVTASSTVTASGVLHTPQMNLPQGANAVVVTAVDRAGNSATATWSFSVDTVAPTVPELLSPAVGAFATTPTPALDWGDSSDTGGFRDYDVEVAADSVFTLPIEWGTTLAPSTAATAPLADGGHFWRVRARDNAGNVSSWSVVRAFTVDTVIPTMPAPVYPADGAFVTTATPTLAWDDSTDANGIQDYDVEADADAAFTSPLEWNASVVPSTAVAASLAEGQHFWRIRSRDVAGNVSDWCEVRRFVVDTIAPAVPVLLTPSDGALLATGTPTLDWEDSTDANGIQDYDAEVSADAAFSPPIEWNSTVVTSTAGTSLLADGQHSWRARARDAAGNVSAWSVVRAFTVDTGAPSVPVLQTPVDGAFVTTSTPTLDWDDSTDTNGVQDYDVEVGADSAFTPPIEWNATIAPSMAVSVALADGQHFWRVRARDAAGNVSSWSLMRSFAVDTVLPTVPILLAPAGGAFVTTAAPTLDWTDSADANGILNYDVEVDGDVAFTPPLDWNATVGASTAITGALAEGQHFWRARSRDNAGNASDWSAVSSFIVDTIAPTVPDLVAPADGALLRTSTPTLDWSDSTDANAVQDYDAEVDGDPGFTAPIEWSTTVVASTAVSAPLGDAEHFWRVRSRDAAGNVSDWSAVRNFTVDTVVPAAPVLQAPADGAFVATSAPALDWSDSTDVNGIRDYDVEVDSDAGFAPPLEWTDTTVASTAVTAGLAEGQHSWRARARDNAGNLSDWSAVRSFAVDTVAPTAPALLTPTDGALLATSTPTLDWTDSTDANGIQNYDVDVDGDTAFAPPIEWNATVAPSTTTTAALADGQHFWRVRSRDNAGNTSGWSVVRSLVVDTVAPTVPTLLAPSDGALLATSTPSLDWADSTDVNGIQDYDAEVSADAAFTPPAEWTAAVVASTAVSAPLGDAEHFWRARSRDNAGNVSDWSVVASFIVDTAAPTAPTLLTPSDGALLGTSTPALDWSDSADANGIWDYDVEADGDAAFTPPLDWNASVVASAATIAALSDGQHSWRVRARDNAGNTSAWSLVRGFTTDTGAPTVPILLSPADGAFVATAAPTLDWEDVGGAVAYDVEVSPNGGFTPPLDLTATVAESTATTGALADGQHFWRVSARDAAGNVSGWSGIRSFTVDTAAPFFDLIEPPDGATTENTAPTIRARYSDEGSGIDVSTVTIAVRGQDVTNEAATTVTASEVSYTPPDPIDGIILVAVSVSDLAGNTSARQWSFDVVGAATVTVAEGPANPQGGDVSQGQANVSVLQLALSRVSGGRAIVRSIRVAVSGTADDVSTYQSVRLILDSNADGLPQVGEATLSQGNYTSDDGDLTFGGLSVELFESVPVAVLVVASLRADAVVDRTFGHSLSGATAVMAENGSGESLAVSGGSVAGASFRIRLADSTPPSIIVASPGRDSVFVNETSITAYFSADDSTDGTGVAYLAGSIDGTTSVLSGAPVDVSALASGRHVLTVVARDNVGNEGRAEVAFFLERVSAARGPAQPGSGSVAPGSTNTTLLHFRVSRAGSTVPAALTNVRLQASGSGADHMLARVALVEDLDSDGTMDAGEPSPSSGQYPTDNGTLTLIAVNLTSDQLAAL